MMNGSFLLKSGLKRKTERIGEDEPLRLYSLSGHYQRLMQVIKPHLQS